MGAGGGEGAEGRTRGERNGGIANQIAEKGIGNALIDTFCRHRRRI